MKNIRWLAALVALLALMLLVGCAQTQTPAEGQDVYLTDPVPEGKPEPVDPQTVQTGTEQYTCTMSISCAALLEAGEQLDAQKAELVPEDGWVLPPTEVTFTEGESVFDVLQRVCRENRLHMEFTNTPLYNSAYIEGIANLYEFDAGELSGWVYSVNDWFPNYGCSRYQLRQDDVVCWQYSCNLGKDVGGSNGYVVTQGAGGAD